MKKLIVVIFIFFTVNSYSQKITEKKIASFPADTSENYYDFSYDSENGTYVRMSYDSGTDKYSLESNKGKSAAYTFFEFYSLLYDKYGNYYVVAQTYNSESDSKSFFLKNGREIATYGFINGNISVDDDYVYFNATDNEKSFVGKYNFRKEKLEFSKYYEYINLCAYDKEAAGEPVFTFGFDESGKLYYIAGLDGKEFIVIGDKEQKKFTSVDSYSVTLDLNGDVCYVGTDDSGSYSHLIQGSKEYMGFNYVRGPAKFDNDNVPVYLASDDIDNTQNLGIIVYGNKKTKTNYLGGIYDFAVSPSGKIAFVVLESTENDSKSLVVYQGKESKKYDNIYNLMFNSDDKLIYSASEKDMSTLVVDNKETGAKYSNIYYVTISPDNKICYIGQNYKVQPDSTRSDESYFVIGDKVLGPYYDFINDYDMNYDNFVFDESGSVAFIASDEAGNDSDVTGYKVFTDKWSSDPFGIIQNLGIYDKNVYYLAFTDEPQTYAFYKNKKKISRDYKSVLNLKYDDDNVSFIGNKDNSYYFVTIEL